jgi:hypothetical protein
MDTSFMCRLFAPHTPSQPPLLPRFYNVDLHYIPLPEEHEVWKSIMRFFYGSVKFNRE